MSVDPVLEPAIAAPEVEPALESAGQRTGESTGAGLARATSVLAIGNIASRALGLGKTILLSHYFGARNGLVDAFTIATTIPQDLYDLAISGHVNSALVPVLSEYAAKDRDDLWRLVSALVGLVVLAVSALVLLLEAFAPQVIVFYRGSDVSAWALDRGIHLFAPWLYSLNAGLSEQSFNMTVYLLRLTSPALLFLSLFAVISGLLYALKRFTWPAFGTALFNGTVVVTMVALAPIIGIERAAIGWVLGAFAQLALQFGGLQGVRLRFQLRGTFSHPGVRRLGLLYIPVLASLVMDVLINRPFSYNLASQVGNGVIAYMDWATSLREFPMGLVATAISLAILPTLARQALRVEERQAFKDTLGQGIRLTLMLILPATVGMFALAGPLIGLIFEHGSFTATDTETMSNVLRLYLAGIPFAAIDLLLIFAFYAVKDTWTPALVGMFSLGCYIVVALILQPAFSFYGLMVADSLKQLIHMSICLILLRRRFGEFGSQRFPITLLKVILATIVMGLITYAVARSVPILWPIEKLPQRAVLVLLPSLLGAATYFILASLLKLNEFTWFVQALGRKIKK